MTTNVRRDYCGYKFISNSLFQEYHVLLYAKKKKNAVKNVL